MPHGWHSLNFFPKPHSYYFSCIRRHCRKIIRKKPLSFKNFFLIYRNIIIFTNSYKNADCIFFIFGRRSKLPNFSQIFYANSNFFYYFSFYRLFCSLITLYSTTGKCPPPGPIGISNHQNFSAILNYTFYSISFWPKYKPI